MIKKLSNLIYNTIKYEYLEYFSCYLLISWAVSPVIEYFLKNQWRSSYTSYFVFSIYFIGILGILEYLIYFMKIRHDKKISLKDFIPHLMILSLVIISIISSISSDYSHLSFFGEEYRKEGLIVYIMYIGFILSASIIHNKKYINFLFNTIILSSCVIVILPLFSNSFTYYYFSNIFHNTNHYAYYLMISTILAGFIFINKKGFLKIIYLLIYILLIHMLIRSDTFGCLLALSISFLFLFVYSLIKKYRRKDIIILISIFIISSFLISHFDIKIGERKGFENPRNVVFDSISSFSKDIKTIINNNDGDKIESVGNGRGLLWKEAWNYTLENPLIGGGMESLNKYYKAKGVTYNDRPHNTILQISSFIGIPGAIIYLMLIIYLAFVNLGNINKDIVNTMTYITAMSYFISSIFGNSMYYTSPYFMILLGFLMGMNYQEKNKDQ